MKFEKIFGLYILKTNLYRNSTIHQNINFMTFNPSRVLFIACTLLCTLSGKAQNISYAWANKAGGGTAEEGRCIQTDITGNVYVSGYFAGTADFDPGPGMVNLTALGGKEIFIAKYNPDGGLIWAKKIGSTSDEIANALRLDADGNLYLIGSFQGGVDFDPNAGTAFLTSSGSDDVFIAKYNASGVYQWAQKIGGTQSDIGSALELDEFGNLTITGLFRNQADFDPGAGSLSLTSNGGSDAFLARYTNAGTLIWAINAGGTQDDAGASLQIDADDHIYLTGKFTGIADFNPSGITNALVSNGLTDLFLACYDASGNYVWANGLGGGVDDSGNALKIGPDGNLYLTGGFQGSVDFDPGANTALLTGLGDEDIVLACYDPNGGAYHWAKAIVGASADRATDLQVTKSGDIYLTGHFSLDCSFESGLPSATLSSMGGRDMFIATYNLSGAFNGVIQIGGSNDDSPNAILINEDGSLYLSGYFRGAVDFDPGANTATLTSTSFFDIFIAKYQVCLQADVLQNPEVQIVCENSSAVFQVDAVNAVSYTWLISLDGAVTWTPIPDTSTTYLGANTSTLSIPSASSAQNGLFLLVIAQSACGLADTGITVLQVRPDIFTSLNVQICQGGTFYFPDGSSSDTSTTFVQTLQSYHGCDSSVTYVLTVLPVDTTVLLNGVTLTATGNAEAIQWVECNNNYTPIPGATDSVFTPILDGVYAAILTQNGCVDTSACFTLIIGETQESSFGAKFRVYPNPVLDRLQIDLGTYVSGETRLQITDMLGKTIYAGLIGSSGKESIETADWLTGIYRLCIADGAKLVARVIVKN